MRSDGGKRGKIKLHDACSPISQRNCDRLTDERWLHISEEHAELAGYLFDVIETVETPKAVVAGAMGELLAFREIKPGR